MGENRKNPINTCRSKGGNRKKKPIVIIIVVGINGCYN